MLGLFLALHTATRINKASSLLSITSFRALHQHSTTSSNKRIVHCKRSYTIQARGQSDCLQSTPENSPSRRILTSRHLPPRRTSPVKRTTRHTSDCWKQGQIVNHQKTPGLSAHQSNGCSSIDKKRHQDKTATSVTNRHIEQTH